MVVRYNSLSTSPKLIIYDDNNNNGIKSKETQKKIIRKTDLKPLTNINKEFLRALNFQLNGNN